MWIYSACYQYFFFNALNWIEFLLNFEYIYSQPISCMEILNQSMHFFRDDFFKITFFTMHSAEEHVLVLKCFKFHSSVFTLIHSHFLRFHSSLLIDSHESKVKRIAVVCFSRCASAFMCSSCPQQVRQWALRVTRQVPSLCSRLTCKCDVMTQIWRHLSLLRELVAVGNHLWCDIL